MQHCLKVSEKKSELLESKDLGAGAHEQPVITSSSVCSYFS